MQNITIPSASIGRQNLNSLSINLVANTSPVTLGADPVQDPDSTFSFGLVSADYSSPNLYKYVKRRYDSLFYL